MTDYDPTPKIADGKDYREFQQYQMEQSGFFTPDDPNYEDDSSEEDMDTDARHEAEWEAQTYEHYSGDHSW